MQHKVIHTSSTKTNKVKNDQRKTITIINTILANNNELSKHKSHEIYNQYSPTNLANTNNNNISTNNNNTKKNTTLANTIKQIILYSGAKKIPNPQNINEKDLKNNVNTKGKNNKELNNNNLPKEENSGNNLIKILKKNNLDNILSESDSCQEIDSMEEDSLSKGNRIKSSNINLKNIDNMKWDILDNKNNKVNNMNYKRHLTSGFSNNINIEDDKNSLSNFPKQKTLNEKKTKNMNINENNDDSDEDIIVDDNEFDNSRSIQNEKLNETKFPKLSINPFIGESISHDSNNNSKIYKKNISNKKEKNKISKNENIISNHHLKSSTFGKL